MKDKYIERGYLVIENLISPQDIKNIRNEINRLSSINRNEQLVSIHQIHKESDIMKSIFQKPSIKDVLSELVGCHLPYWDGGVKMMQSTLLIKPPGTKGYNWHQDERYIPTRDRSLTTIWIAIDESHVENGGISMIPGSHKMGFMFPTRKNSDDYNCDDLHLESFGFEENKIEQVELKPGSAIIWNGYTLHKSTLNSTNKDRTSLIGHFCNSWSILPWKIQPGSHSWADDRNVDIICGADPYFWKGINVDKSDIIYNWHKKD